MSQLFDDINESLLRGGIAPRHVKRYIRELSDHFEDLLREEIADGTPTAEAQTAARRRLGSNEMLTGAMLKRSDLLSVTARFPALVFGAGPVLTLIGSIVFGIVVEKEFLSAHLAVTHWLNSSTPAADAMIAPPGWLKLSLETLNWVLTYALPLIIAAVAYVIGQRQRIAPRWIAMAGAIIGALRRAGLPWLEQSSVSSEHATMSASDGPTCRIIPCSSLAFWGRNIRGPRFGRAYCAPR